METAFILLKTKIGTEKQTLKQLKNISSVREAFLTSGTYDIICKISELDLSMLKDIINRKIRHISDISSILTLIVTKLLS